MLFMALQLACEDVVLEKILLGINHWIEYILLIHYQSLRFLNLTTKFMVIIFNSFIKQVSLQELEAKQPFFLLSAFFN